MKGKIIFMSMKRKDKVDKNKSKKEKNSFLSLLTASDESLIDIMPYKRITEEGFLLDKNDEYQVFLRIKTYDFQSMNDEDLESLINVFTTMTRVYVDPIKYISLTYKTETHKQQKFYEDKIANYEKQLLDETISNRQVEVINNKRLRAIEELNRMEFIEKRLKDKMFIVVLYAKDKRKLVENIRTIQRQGSRSFGLQVINQRAMLESIVTSLINMKTD